MIKSENGFSKWLSFHPNWCCSLTLINWIREYVNNSCFGEERISSIPKLSITPIFHSARAALIELSYTQYADWALRSVILLNESSSSTNRTNCSNLIMNCIRCLECCFQNHDVVLICAFGASRTINIDVSDDFAPLNKYNKCTSHNNNTHT